VNNYFFILKTEAGMSRKNEVAQDFSVTAVGPAETGRHHCHKLLDIVPASVFRGEVAVMKRV
jgi:hypothetical protein